MLNIALLDTEWDRYNGLVSAPIPDSNVLLKIPNKLKEAICAARKSIRVLHTLYSNSMDKAYIVMQAPMVEGKLYCRFSSLFGSRPNRAIVVSVEHVLYVLECEIGSYRMTYDITNHFLTE